jgi:5-methylcytosine-specific restriction endonuclease McrA
MSCHLNQRDFPISWKEAYFRQKFNKSKGGYICPLCNQVFCGLRGFKQLRGDHIIPFSKGGLTIWDNFQLICCSCNSKKSNFY